MGRFSTLRMYDDDIATRLIVRAPSTSNRDTTNTCILAIYAGRWTREMNPRTPDLIFSSTRKEHTATRRNRVSCVLTSQSASYKMKRQRVERDKCNLACLVSIVDIICTFTSTYCKIKITIKKIYMIITVSNHLSFSLFIIFFFWNIVRLSRI